MANISSYPLIAPKVGDLILFTETYDINAAAPVIGNPTRATTLKEVIALVPSPPSVPADVYTKTVTLTPVQILAIDPADNTTWPEVVAAPGADKILQLLDGFVYIDYQTTDYNNTNFKINNTTSNNAGSGYGYYAELNSSSGVNTYWSIVSTLPNMKPNEPLVLMKPTSTPQSTQGDSPIKLYLRYRIVDLS